MVDWSKSALDALARKINAGMDSIGTGGPSGGQVFDNAFRAVTDGPVFDTSEAWAKVDARPAGMSRDEYLNQFRSNVPKGDQGPKKWKTKQTLEQNIARRKMMRDNKKGAKHLEAATDSTCFSSLVWDQTDGNDGIATAVFARTNTTYQYEVTRSEFQEWANGSQGGYFNDSDLYDNYL